MAATFELEMIGGLRGKEDALAAVALGEARRLALRELGDRRKVVGQTEFLTYSTEDSDAVVDDFHDQRFVPVPNGHGRFGARGVVDRVVEHLREAIGNDVAQVL